MLPGRISEIVPDAQSASRTFQVKVTGEFPSSLYTGMFGRIFIPLEQEDVLVIPRAAVRHVGQLELVDVDGRAATPAPRGADGPDHRGGLRSAVGPSGRGEGHRDRRRGDSGRVIDGGSRAMNPQDPVHSLGQSVAEHHFTNKVVASFLEYEPFAGADSAGHAGRRAPPVAHASGGRPADRRAAGGCLRKLPGAFRDRGRAAWSPRRWRRSSTRSTAWNTSTR